MGRGNFDGEKASHCKVWGHSAVICVTSAEPIKMLFGLWARTGPRNHELDGVQGARMGGHVGATWKIRLNRISAAAIQSYVKLL